MTSRLVVMKNVLAELVQISGELGSGFAFVLVLRRLRRRELNRADRHAVERFGRDLGTGGLRLLGGSFQDVEHLLLVLAGVGQENSVHRETALGGAFSRGILGDRGNRQRSLRKLDQISDAHTDLFIEVLGDIGQFVVQLLAKVFERRVVPELAVLARAESLAKRLGVVELEHEHGRVGQDSLGGCRSLSLLDREPQRSDEPHASEESPAKYRDLRRTHQMKLRFSGTPRSPGEGVGQAPRQRARVGYLAPGSKPGPPPAVTDEPLQLANSRPSTLTSDVVQRAGRFISGPQTLKACLWNQRPSCPRSPAPSGPPAGPHFVGAGGRDTENRCSGWPCHKQRLPDDG